MPMNLILKKKTQWIQTHTESSEALEEENQNDSQASQESEHGVYQRSAGTSNNDEDTRKKQKRKEAKQRLDKHKNLSKYDTTASIPTVR